MIRNHFNDFFLRAVVSGITLASGLSSLQFLVTQGVPSMGSFSWSGL